MSTIDKILYFLKENNYSQNDLLNYIGIKRKATFSEWKSGTSNSYNKYIDKIAEFFSVSTDYLLTDKDSNIQKDSAISPEYQSLIESYNQLDPNNKKMAMEILKTMYEVQAANKKRSEIEVTTIKLMTNKASAGTGYSLEGAEYTPIQIVKTPEAEYADYAVRVDGESMLPDFHDGDIVLIKKQPEIEIGQVGIFICNNEGYIKERGEDRLISRNPECDDVFPTEDDQIICVGLVLGIAEQVE